MYITAEGSDLVSLYLNREEEDMLDGEYGEGVAFAMKVLVAIANAFDAERMVEITRAHVALSNQEADLWFVEKLVEGGAKCRIPPTVNPAYDLEYFQMVNSVASEDVEIINRTREAYKKIGAVLTYSCTPYLESNIPRFGEIVAFSESSATPYINSVYGARTNREAAQSALCAAVTGRVPLYGMLLDRNRKGSVLVDVQAEMKDDFDYQLLGYATPSLTGHGVPVFVGLPQRITPEQFMNLGAELNTAGAVPLYHVVGVTPEAPTIDDAFHSEKPEKEVVITRKKLEETHGKISVEGGKIDFALFGCPHFTIKQVKEVSDMVEGKSLAVELWIMTSFSTRELARRMGYVEIIEDAGGHIVADTCWDQPCWHHLRGKKGVTDSPKMAFYSKRRGMDFVVRSVPEAVEAALRGRV